MNRHKVILVSMPWELLDLPSIQLGTLRAVLERAGHATEVRSFYLTLMDYLISSTANLADDEKILLDHYNAVASKYWTVGMGDWIFAVPPYLDFNSESDEAYFVYLRSQGIPEGAIAKAVQMRKLIPAFLEGCVEDIRTAAPSIVGFTSSFSQNVPSLVLSKLLKMRNPSLRIVFGGANCDGAMGAALHRTFPWIDVVVRGEGEHVLPELVRSLLGGEAIKPQPGLCFRKGEQSVVVPQTNVKTVAMDEVPIPNYDEYFARLRKSQFGSAIAPDIKILFESARGCWWGEKHHCTFCGLNGSLMTFRSKSVGRIIDELFALAAKYQRIDFEAVDNIIDMKYMQDLLPRLHIARKAGFDFNFFYETKANLKKEHLRLMRDAGISAIQPGIESLSTPILKLMKKGVTGLQNIRLLKWAGQFNIRVLWNVIYGFPGEPREEYDRMAEIMQSLTHLQPPNLVGLRVERFSPYYDSALEFGLEILGPAPYYRFLYAVDEITLNELAYDFQHRYQDGRNPSTYIAAIRDVIETWKSTYHVCGINSLRYYRGPGFLKISDRRPNLQGRIYSFGETEALIYLTCDSGATPIGIWETLRLGEQSDITVGEVKDFLDELVKLRLIYEEDGRYLSLALPSNTEAEGLGIDVQPGESSMPLEQRVTTSQ
jgi:ribosomal peptide maturation radical SAM protein 1